MSELFKGRDIVLYHYSKEKYNSILSKTAQGYKGNQTGEYVYNDSVSFFLSPIPRNLPDILENQHEFWKSGQELYEYKVTLNAFPEDIKYVLTESEEKTELLYEKQDWDIIPSSKNGSKIMARYLQEIREMELEKGYMGEGLSNLVKVCKKYSGRSLVPYYMKVAELHKKYPNDGLMSKYAACVPHLKLYVGKMVINYNSVTKIKLK